MSSKRKGKKHWNSQTIQTSLNATEQAENVLVGGVSGLQACEAMVHRLGVFCKNHQEDFSAFWRGLSVQERKALLRTVSPYMPESVNNATAHGERVDGAVILMPEMTLQHLAVEDNGNRLLEILKYRAETTNYRDQIWKDLEYIEPVYKQGVLKKQYRHTYTMVSTEESFGQNFEVLEPNNPSVKKFTEERCWVDANLFYYAFQRCLMILQTLLFVVDEYRTEIKGRSLLDAAVLIGCHTCKRPEREGGKRLLACGRCGKAFYCSVECQRADWKTHKKTCEPKKQAAASESKTNTVTETKDDTVKPEK